MKKIKLVEAKVRREMLKELLIREIRQLTIGWVLGESVCRIIDLSLSMFMLGVFIITLVINIVDYKASFKNKVIRENFNLKMREVKGVVK